MIPVIYYSSTRFIHLGATRSSQITLRTLLLFVPSVPCFICSAVRHANVAVNQHRRFADDMQMSHAACTDDALRLRALSGIKQVRSATCINVVATWFNFNLLCPVLTYPENLQLGLLRNKKQHQISRYHRVIPAMNSV